ncbi:hypothetical protein, partial [Enterococcus faecalis]|uniref:hypothetical protein n=1 Tax=Enterococcus faecalis TaxID=1351 RepID=UPI001C8E0140
GYAASGAQARSFFTTPFPVVEILEKILIPPCLSFPLRPCRGVREPSQKSPDLCTLLTLKISTPHAKLNFCR